MKLYPDGVAEGTPEEVAAFKHIDAALTAKNGRKAIEGPRPKKAPAKKTTPPKKQARASKDDMEKLNQQILDFLQTSGGGHAAELAEYLGIDRKKAYRLLYNLRTAGRLWLTDDGVFKVVTMEREAS